jgi:serine/threonine protein kinase
MIDSTGYLRIIDFGSAKVIKLGERSSTICGTPEYLPPEMVLSKEYNRGVDFWNLGIFFYELYTRNTPFANPNLVNKITDNLFCSYL